MTESCDLPGFPKLGEEASVALFWAFSLNLTADQAAQAAGVSDQAASKAYGALQALTASYAWHHQSSVDSLDGIVEIDEASFGNIRVGIDGEYTSRDGLGALLGWVSI